MYLINLAGDPPITQLLGKDLVTVEFAPTVTLSPRITPASITAPEPIQQLFPISTEFMCNLFLFSKSWFPV